MGPGPVWILCGNLFAHQNSNTNHKLLRLFRYDVDWNFGALTFEDITIVAEGSATSSWCTSNPSNYNSATSFTITGAKASVSGTTVTCTIEKLVLNGPA